MPDLCFLKPEYFQDIRSNVADKQNLQENKQDSASHSRPYFIAMQDKRNPQIYWAVPLSSQYDKYESIFYASMNKYHRCDTIALGELMGRNQAFLIQNLCPISSDYIKNFYCNKKGKPIWVSNIIKNEVVEKVKYVLEKNFHGVILSYTNTSLMYNALNEKLNEKRAGNFNDVAYVLRKHEQITSEGSKSMVGKNIKVNEKTYEIQDYDLQSDVGMFKKISASPEFIIAETLQVEQNKQSFLWQKERSFGDDWLAAEVEYNNRITRNSLRGAAEKMITREKTSAPSEQTQISQKTKPSNGK